MPESNPFPSRRELRRRAQQAQAEADRETRPVEPAEPRARRAADSPVDAPTLRNRRVDAEATQTGKIPLITGSRLPSSQPLTRREARLLREREATGQIEVPLPQPDEQSQQVEEPRPDTEYQQVEVLHPDTEYQVADTPITTFGIAQAGTDVADVVQDVNDSIELQREAIAEESATLAQEIAEVGAKNPQVIDPELLARQQELARKAQEINELEAAVTSQQEPATAATSQQEPADPVTSQQESAAPVTEFTDLDQPETPQQLPIEHETAAQAVVDHITGEHSVVQTQEVPVSAPEPEEPHYPVPEQGGVPKRQNPIEADAAHGLDPLEATESAAWERKLLVGSGILAVIGILTLIIGIYLIIIN